MKLEDMPKELQRWYSNNKDTASADDLARFELLRTTSSCTATHFHPDEEVAGKLRGQNTAYVDILCNWSVLCEDCQREEDAYWEERWQEYNTGLGLF